MKKKQGYFIYKLADNSKQRLPLSGQLELTYRCNLNCVHCYCKGSENKGKELSAAEWKKIILTLRKAGCLFLCFTGGEPFIRKDFLEIYYYAKKQGFIITLFTNGLLLDKKTASFLEKYPPFSVEITLNGITKDTYEAITQAKGSFSAAMDVINELAERKLPLIIKSNCLKQNKDEIARIKAFTDKLLGRGKRRWKFKYDPMIYPRLNRDKAPCKYRLLPSESLQLKKSEPEIWEQHEQDLCAKSSRVPRNRAFLYQCRTWREQFFIDPFGQLKFCEFLDKFSTDLRERTFEEGFYNVFPGVRKELFKTSSKCITCGLRPLCYTCPGRAYLETGDEESPVEYFCKLAKARVKETEV